MRIRRHLGSPAVRDLVERARLRQLEQPERSVRDPWPTSDRVVSETVTDKEPR